MINNNELRTGNIVSVYGKFNVIVIEIDCNGITYDRVDGSEVAAHVEWIYTHPIPLTPEILERVFGATEFGENGNMFTVRTDDEIEIDIFLWAVGIIEIRLEKEQSFFLPKCPFYVHDLQNIGYWLNGKRELPIYLKNFNNDK